MEIIFILYSMLMKHPLSLFDYVCSSTLYCQLIISLFRAGAAVFCFKRGILIAREEPSRVVHAIPDIAGGQSGPSSAPKRRRTEPEREPGTGVQI
jgi:hypothetical protein